MCISLVLSQLFPPHIFFVRFRSYILRFFRSPSAVEIVLKRKKRGKKRHSESSWLTDKRERKRKIQKKKERVNRPTTTEEEEESSNFSGEKSEHSRYFLQKKKQNHTSSWTEQRKKNSFFPPNQPRFRGLPILVVYTLTSSGSGERRRDSLHDYWFSLYVCTCSIRYMRMGTLDIYTVKTENSSFSFGQWVNDS